MKSLFALLLVAASVFTSNAGWHCMDVVVGAPAIIRFDDCLCGNGTYYRFTHDGEEFEADSTRTFKRCGIIFITNITDSDFGNYTLNVGDGDCQQIVCVEERDGDPDEFERSADMCMMSVMAHRQDRSLAADADEEVECEDLPPTACAAQRIRKLWHFTSEQGGIQGRARMLVEDLIRLAQNCSSTNISYSDLLETDAAQIMLEFASCANATMMYDCDTPTVNKFRTIDGTCNNRNNPLWGASNTALRRLGPSKYEDGVQQPVGYDQQLNGDPFGPPWPSARQVSWTVVRDLPGTVSFSALASLWALYVVHDMNRVGEFATASCELRCDLEDLPQFCYPILVNPEDTIFGSRGPNAGRCLPFSRSIGECIQQQFSMAREQGNEVTHFLDASAVYGSTVQEAASLRSFKCGCLKVGGRQESGKGNPPFTSQPSAQGIPLFAWGDFRANGVTAVMTIHTILLREHNRLAAKIAEINPCWDDERIYQEARKLLIATIQSITYREFLPALYGEHFDTYIGNYTGYNRLVNPTVTNEFAVAAFRFGHSMLHEGFPRLDENNRPLPIGPLGFRESTLNSFQYFISGGTDPLLRGLIQDRSRTWDSFYNRVITTQFFSLSDSQLGQDIASRDIQRGRDHAISPYRYYEELCRNIFGVNSNFDDTCDTVSTLKRVYGRHGFDTKMDLLVGMNAEQRLGGAEIGPTAACIIALTMRDVRDGDRFWYENRRVFNRRCRQSLSEITFARLVCDNADNISSIKRNVFVVGGEEIDCKNIPRLHNRCFIRKGCPTNTPRGQC